MRVEAKGGVRVQAGPGTSCPSLPITLAIAQPQPMHVPAPPGGGGHRRVSRVWGGGAHGQRGHKGHPWVQGGDAHSYRVFIGTQDSVHREVGVPMGSRSRCEDPPKGSPHGCHTGVPLGYRVHTGLGCRAGLHTGVADPGGHPVPGEGAAGQEGHRGSVSPHSFQGSPSPQNKSRGTPHPDSPKAFLGCTRRRVKG